MLLFLLSQSRNVKNRYCSCKHLQIFPPVCFLLLPLWPLDGVKTQSGLTFAQVSFERQWGGSTGTFQGRRGRFIAEETETGVKENNRGFTQQWCPQDRHLLLTRTLSPQPGTPFLHSGQKSQLIQSERAGGTQRKERSTSYRGSAADPTAHASRSSHIDIWVHQLPLRQWRSCLYWLRAHFLILRCTTLL